MNKQYGVFRNEERVGTLYVEYNIGPDRLSCRAFASTTSWLDQAKASTPVYRDRSYSHVVDVATSALACFLKCPIEQLERRDETLPNTDDIELDLRQADINWQQSRIGRRTWAYDTRPQDIHLAEIAYGLREGRFANQTLGLYTYSVAQHSVHASYLGDLSPHARMAKLLHDAHEAVFKDMPKPLRNHPGMEDYNAGCDARQRVINVWANLDPDAHHMYDVKKADMIMLATERRDLMAPNDYLWMKNPHNPMQNRIRIWDQPFSVYAFLITFLDLAYEVCPDRVDEADQCLFSHVAEMREHALLYDRRDVYEGAKL